MIDLPPSIAPWRTLNALLPRELAAGLGPWVERLVLAMGPLRAARPRPGGEPDGFSGITRRGSYERLLLSEWLLADELPEEFARRATMGEHAFHAVARRTPSLAASSVALFDAGPDQLGSPRIVHLAALITLAERAERAGARFAWGLLHDPDGALFPSVTAESALRLIGGRTALPTGEDALRAWSTRARKSGWEDVWIVGRSALPRLPGAMWTPATIEAHDVLDPERRAVRVVVSLPSSPARELDLDLPEERACARLLRDPFLRAQAAPARATADLVISSNLIFAANGHKLFARGRGGEIVAYPVPSDPARTPGRPKRYFPKSQGVAAAVGWINRGLVMLIADESELRFERTSGKQIESVQRPIALPASLGFAVPTLNDPLAPLVFPSFSPYVLALALDAKRSLHELSSAFEPSISRVVSEVAGIAVVRQQIAMVARGIMPGATIARARLDPGDDAISRSPHRWLLLVVGPPGRPSSLVALPGEGTFETVFGFTENASAAVLVAVQQREAGWTIHGAADPITLYPPSGTRVVGVYQGRGDSNRELLVLESDRRTISLLGQSTSRSLPRASAEIVQVAQSTSHPMLAYLTVTGKIVIHSLLYDPPLARYLPREGAP